MNRRERILALTALTVVILAGGGLLFKFLFLDALYAVNAQIAAAQDDIDKKQTDMTKEGQDRQGIFRRDPRLAHWEQLSLPENNKQEQELKAGRPLDEIKKRHEDSVQVDYERFLSDLVMRNGFAANTIKVSAAAADRKGGPILSGKTPAYTRMSFTVQGTASLEAVVRMLQDFYRTPLLHEVRNLTLTSRPQQNRPSAAAAPAAFGQGGPPSAQPAPPPGGALGGAADLDVNMTVEALLVTGAEKRDGLLPESNSAQAPMLPDPPRMYTDILAKNMFTGIAADSKLSEDRSQVLAVVKLTAVWNSGRRWEATIYDQGKGGDEKRVAERTLTDFTIYDKYNNVLVEGKIVKMDGTGVVFQADKKYYRWLLGDFLGRVLDAPLKSSELMELGVKDAAPDSEN